MDLASTSIGTPYYMSPEQYKHKPYSYKSYRLIYLGTYGLLAVFFTKCATKKDPLRLCLSTDSLSRFFKLTLHQCLNFTRNSSDN